jgi:RNA polymerase sigma-70 factor, ECF subfamily
MWLFKRNSSKTDEELLLAFRESGNKNFFAELFKNHVSTVYGTCLFYLKDKDEAKDEVMNIFEKLLQDLKQSDVKNFKAWLSFVVRNHCISVIRKKNTAFKTMKAYYEFEYKETTYDSELKTESVSDDELLLHLNECLPRLKDKQRQCIELFYLKNLSYQQVSEMTGMEINEVKSNIQNGKRNLKLMISLQHPDIYRDQDDKLRTPRK